MTLTEAILAIQYDSSWGIWAEQPITPASEARYGQVQFRNGGLLDDKVLFATGEECGNFIMKWLDGEDEDVEYPSELAEAMIEAYAERLAQ